MPSNMPQQIWSAVQDLAGIDSGGCIRPYCVASTSSHASSCTAASALLNRLTQRKEPISIKSILLSTHLCHGGFTEHLTLYHLAICCRHPPILQKLPPQPSWSPSSACLSCHMHSATLAPLVMSAQSPLHTICIKPSMPSEETTVHGDLSILQLKQDHPHLKSMSLQVLTGPPSTCQQSGRGATGVCYTATTICSWPSHTSSPYCCRPCPL